VEAISSAPMRQLLSSLPPGKTSSPLVAPDGILVVMVCSKETRNVAEPTREEVTSQILQERAEQAARQLLSDLRRRAIIERRGA
jgi:peptidyl-prolyl cis-trans isomerase SurA